MPTIFPCRSFDYVVLVHNPISFKTGLDESDCLWAPGCGWVTSLGFVITFGSFRDDKHWPHECHLNHWVISG